MFNTVGWKAIAELIGLSAIVGSLIFVGMQLRQEQEIAIVDTYGSVVEANEAVLSLIAEHVETWEKGLRGDDLSDSEGIVFAAMVRAVFNHHAQMFIRFARIGPGDPQDVLEDFAYAIYLFPGLRNQWEADYEFQDHRDAALDRAQSALDFRFRTNKYLNALDERQPSIPANRQFIFWFF